MPGANARRCRCGRALLFVACCVAAALGLWQLALLPSLQLPAPPGWIGRRVGAAGGAGSEDDAYLHATALQPLLDTAGEGPEICFLVRVMPKHLRNLPPMLLGLFASAAPRYSVRVLLLRSYANPPEGDGLESIAALINAAVPGDRVEISRWDSTYTERHYPHLERVSYAKDGGFVVTDLALEDILARRREEQAAAGAGPGAGEAGGGGYGRHDEPSTPPSAGFCDALVVTNGDNLYTGGFVPAVVEQLRAGQDVVAVHFVSRYTFSPELQQYNRKFGRGPLRPGSDAEFLPTFAPGGIDLGAAAVRTDVLERHGIRFVVDRLRREPTGRGINFQQADGHYFSVLSKLPGVKSIILPRTLFVHQ